MSSRDGFRTRDTQIEAMRLLDEHGYPARPVNHYGMIGCRIGARYFWSLADVRTFLGLASA